MAKSSTIDWEEGLKPLIRKYKDKKHPLNYENLYQLLVMVVLSAQSNDALINKYAPAFFEVFPDMTALSNASAEDLYPYVNKVIGFRKKSDWLIRIAKEVKADKNIPLTMEGLTQFPGIGRKSANVIMREAGVKAEGVMVDLHVVRVGQRLGITETDDPKKIEKDIMDVLPQKMWGEIGMAISHLGREICRPTEPKHADCPVNNVCQYFADVKAGKIKEPKKKKALPGEKPQGRWKRKS
jgi:endonuclease-3